MVPGVEHVLAHVLAAVARRYALQQVVPLREHAPQAREGSRIARLDLDQHLVEEPAPQLGATLDQAKVVGPKQRHPEVTGQVDCPPPCPVDLDRASGASSLNLESDHQLPPCVAGLDLGLDPRGGAPPPRPPPPPAPARRR